MLLAATSVINVLSMSAMDAPKKKPPCKAAWGGVNCWAVVDAPFSSREVDESDQFRGARPDLDGVNLADYINHLEWQIKKHARDGHAYWWMNGLILATPFFLFWLTSQAHAFCSTRCSFWCQFWPF